MNSAAILNLIVLASQHGSGFGPAAQGWAESAAKTLISGLWQGALVACGLALCMRLAPRIPARLRYTVWGAGFAAVVCLPILPTLVERLVPQEFNPATADSFISTSGPAAHPLLALDARWSLGLAALWLAASLLRAASLVAHTARMRRLWISARPVAAPCLDVLLQNTGAPNTVPVQLCGTTDLDRPCVIGFFRPRILIPVWLLNRLTPVELEQVVLHESEHLRRMDDWTNLLQKLCLVIFPLNPALWWLERRLCAEREMACDDAVVGRTQAPRAYAACLAGLAEKGLEQRTTLRLRGALALGAWQRRPELAERVHRLLRRPRNLSPAASFASVALVGCGLVAGTISLARSPQLVAFVTPPSQVSNAISASARLSAPQLIEGDVRSDLIQPSGTFAPSGVQPYRAVKTLAIMPATPAAFLPRNGNPTSRPVSVAQPDEAGEPRDSGASGHSLASLVPTAVAAQMKAQQVSQSAMPPSNQGQATQTGWIVLTTFEEIQTSGSIGNQQGDAVVPESSTSSGAEAHGANSDPGAKAATSISVTRLVLRFVQPASNAQPASKNAPSSNAAQPIAIPYRDGWFVIQL